MTLSRRNIGALIRLFLAVMAPMPMLMSQTVVARAAIGTQSVVYALALAGINVAPDQIEFLSGDRGNVQSASVRVVTVTDSTGGAAKVKLRCRDIHMCLPFYVLVKGLASVNAVRSRLAAGPAIATSLANNVIRGGDHAILVLETSDSRISFPVICLQSGIRGQRIRAASPDHRQFYDAEVVAPGMLKGRL